MRSEDRPSGQDVRTFTEKARRDQFVAAAIETIAEHGYADASLAAVTKRAGVSKSLLLYHFAGKDELVDEVVLALYDEGSRFLRTRLSEDSPPRVWLREYIVACVEFVGLRRAGLIALGEIFANRRTRDGSRDVPDAVGEPERHVSRQLERGQQEGVFRDFSVRVMARAIRSALDDVAGQFGADPSVDLDLWATELATMFDLATRAAD